MHLVQHYKGGIYTVIGTALDILSRKDIGEGAKFEGVRLILKGGVEA